VGVYSSDDRKYLNLGELETLAFKEVAQVTLVNKTLIVAIYSAEGIVNSKVRLFLQISHLQFNSL
jgi:hypothetical protein